MRQFKGDGGANMQIYWGKFKMSWFYLDFCHGSCCAKKYNANHKERIKFQWEQKTSMKTEQRVGVSTPLFSESQLDSMRGGFYIQQGILSLGVQNKQTGEKFPLISTIKNVKQSKEKQLDAKMELNFGKLVFIYDQEVYQTRIVGHQQEPCEIIRFGYDQVQQALLQYKQKCQQEQKEEGEQKRQQKSNGFNYNQKDDSRDS